MNTPYRWHKGTKFICQQARKQRKSCTPGKIKGHLPRQPITIIQKHYELFIISEQDFYLKVSTRFRYWAFAQVRHFLSQ